MKSRILKAKNEELPLKEFLEKFPHFKSNLPSEINIEDTNYIVRFNRDNGFVEIGYADDEWGIEKDSINLTQIKKVFENPNAIKGYRVQVIEMPLSKFLLLETGYFSSDIPKIYRQTFHNKKINYKKDFEEQGIDLSDKSLIARFCSQLRIIEIGHEHDEWVLGTPENGFNVKNLPSLSEIDPKSHYILLKAKPVN